MITKSETLQLLKNTLQITGNNTIDIVNAKNILSSNNIDCSIIQGWKINSQKEYGREAYLYIELYLDNKKYYLNINDSIHISKDNLHGVFKKRPSDKYIAYKMRTS